MDVSRDCAMADLVAEATWVIIELERWLSTQPQSHKSY